MAYYIYGIRTRNTDRPKSKIGRINYKKLQAVVRKIDAGKFEENARDEEWVKKKAEEHMAVLLGLMGNDETVIPFRFGTIFQDKQTVLDYLRDNHKKWRRLIKKLARSEEWGIKIFLGKDFEIQSSKLKTQNSMRGKAYFEKLKLTKQAEKEKWEKVEKRISKILTMLATRAKEVKENKLLLTNMLLNVVFLIDKAHLKDFLNEAEKIENENRKGLKISISGPWPCFHFVEAQENG
jgi:transposase-like protein